MDLVTEHEALLRGAVFLSALIMLLAAERALPRRNSDAQQVTRWSSNVGLVVVDTLLVRLVAPGITITAAVLASEHQWGLLNWIQLPAALTIPLAVVVLDACIYWQHRVMHVVPVLWRLHRVHHADTEFDVTTALRFHPLEIFFSLGIKLVLVTALGVPVVAVILFEIILNASAMFNHANIKLSKRWDRWLRRVIVTPDMHRIHHTPQVAQTNSNYGFCISIWDKIFGTYVDEPMGAQDTMDIGLNVFRDAEDQSLVQLLVQPFRTQKKGHASKT